MHLLPDRLPWFIAGPLIGLLVVAFYVLANRPLGISGAYREVATFLRAPRRAEGWRVWYFVGLAVGALVAALLRGGVKVGFGYDVWRAVIPLGALVPLLVVAGLLIGYGARWAGGCTSGHGLCGTSVRSPGSIVAMATFMGTAIAVTFVIHLVTGGRV